MRKNKIRMRWIVLACALILVIAIVLLFFRKNGEDSGEMQAEETSDENSATASDAEADDEIAMSEEFYRLLAEGFTVLYQGNELSFPCDYTDILGNADGWDVHANGLYDSAVAFGKDDLPYEVLLYFPLDITGDLETLEEAGCSGIGISLISLEESIGEEAPELYMGGITWQDTEAQLVDVFGEPGDRNEVTEDGELIYTYLLYQAEYNGGLYRLEFTVKDGYGVAFMSFYYMESDKADTSGEADAGNDKDSVAADADTGDDKDSVAADADTVAVTDEGDVAVVVTAVEENSTEAEEPEGAVTMEDEDETEGTSASEISEAQKSGGSTATQKTGSSAGTTTGKTEATTTKKTETSTTTKKTEATTTTKNSETTTATKAAETTTAASSTTRTYATEEEKLAILEGINNYRAEQGYTEMPVVLNTFLTEQAQEWADYLAANDLCESSTDRNAMSNLTGDYYWSREYYGAVTLIGKDLSYWVSRGEEAGKNGLYDCPFVGVGAAVNSAGKTILVVQGIHQISVYDSDGYLAFDDTGSQVVYWWWSENSDGSTDFYTENSDFLNLVYKIYETGHFADFVTECYYTDTYGWNDYYRYIPVWIKGSASWLS